MTRFIALALLMGASTARAAEPFSKLAGDYDRQARPLLKAYCLECHSADDKQGELDLERFASLAEVRRDPAAWQKVAEMLDHREMPPKDAKQPGADERQTLRNWVRRYLDAEATASAGDPGPVPLRRLSRAEYTYTVRDLTGVPLDPAREFPADGAAGEGFTNAAAAGVMSPALLQKYFDAAKDISAHAALTPTGIRWSPFTSRRDWTEEALAEIRGLYERDTAKSGGSQVNLQGIVFETNGGGRLPVELYIEATLKDREALRAGTKTILDVASERKLNAKYLQLLWQALEKDVSPSSLLIDRLRSHWRTAAPEQAAELTGEIASWQRSLFRFSSIGHIGKAGGPKGWMESISPLADRQDIRFPLKAPADAKDVAVYLATSDAGDGNEQDFAVWERPRLVAPGRPDILLRDLRSVSARLVRRREQLLQTAQACLNAAAEAATQDSVDVPALAAKYLVEPDALSAWLDYLGIGQPAGLGTPITRQQKTAAGYDFIQGWVGEQALSVVANSSDQHVRIPGNMPPHSLAVHPTPTLEVGVAWKCLKADSIQLDASITHAHPECGNGVTWSLEIRRGQSVQCLANGVSHGGTPVKSAKFEASLRVGDVVALVIGPRDGNHSCDLTNIDLTIRSDSAEWNLSKDVSSDILAGNPHADRQGHTGVWHFFSEPVVDSRSQAIPAGSILAEWQATTDRDKRSLLALNVEKLLASGPVAPADAPDSVMYRQITSLNGPLSAALGRLLNTPGDDTTLDATVGVDPALFGKHPNGSPVDTGNLCVQAPAVVEVRIPADLAEGATLVSAVSLHQPTGRDGSVQAQVLTTRPDGSTALKAGAVAEIANRGPWTSSGKQVAHSSPILATPGGTARARFEASFDDFRNLFPPALCYSKIVPVDEVVTLTLFYREDEPLRRLMLSDAEASRLNALWDELHFVSRDALTLVDAYRQLLEFATQDADPKVFEPLRQPIMDRAAACEKQLIETEPLHLAAVLEFAGRAWRRPLREQDKTRLRGLYRQLRSEGLAHDDAIRLTLARVFVAPDFVYRLEAAPQSAASAPVSDHELATRLSYFLWSSAPDAELRALADAGRLKHPEVLKAQTRRMLKDEKIRRLATEFGCQWLQIYDFDRLDEKSEKHFPEFRELRGNMYEEAIRSLTSIFQQDRSYHAIFVSDDTFANARLAKFYGFKDGGLANDRWQQVSETRSQGRGGVLTMAAVLAKQSGASRTSPILRGNWISEVVLGERLPRPPKGVPPLPEEEAGSDLSVRQLVEKHTSDERCSGCHARIDPFGFALEAFDAIGRQRNQDVNGKPIDSTSRMADGTELAGASGLQKYLLTHRENAVRRQFCRKLLGYALGRSIQLSDEPLMTEMQQRLTANDNRVGVAIEAIVESRQFRQIRGSDAVAAGQ